ncbi:ERAD-associated protein [Ascosphaera atra]|nr:ERAD-associated protein [Ascosphaera atra]
MSQHYLGLMYLEGLGVPQDVVRAATYFKAAADQDYPLAQTRLGVLFLDQGDVMTAVQYFEMAARYGGIEPYYYLAEINDWGLGRERHCAVAAAYYKIVAEKAEVLHSAFAEANKAYEKRDYETAIIAAMMAAEQGYVDAQENVAYLLDDQRTFLPLTWLKLFLGIPEKSAFLRNSTLALVYYTRSAQQTTIDSFNIDSLVKMGDYYLKGTGTEASIDKAFTCYQSAAEGHRSAQALWNLGWMHENGYGVTQDFHMAKRYYDLALETNAEAYLPVKLSLMKLRVRSFWNTITGGKAHSIEPEPKQKQTRTFKEWVAEFISSYKSYNEDEYYDTRYKEQEERRHQQYQDNGMYDDLDGLDEMDLYEMLLILAVVAAMGILIYTRNQRLLARQVLPPAQPQQHQAQQGQGDHRGGEVQHANDVGGNRGGNREEDRGPGNDGPDNPAWTAGGIGH